MEKVRVVPREGIQVREPVTMRIVPPEGIVVPATDLYWHRIVLDGDMTQEDVDNG